MISTIYYIGGISRSGKSTLAKMLLEKNRISYMSTDFLDCFIENPEYKISTPKQVTIEDFQFKSKQFYSVFKDLLKLIRGTTRDFPYTIEGDLFAPEEISKIINDQELNKKIKVKACFFGFSEITQFHKEKYLSQESWARKLSLAELDQLEKHMIEKSNFLKIECKKYNIPFFDTAFEYDSMLERAYAYFII